MKRQISTTDTDAAKPIQPDDVGFYHIYAKACRDRTVFREPADNIVFLALLKQYLRLQTLVSYLDRSPPSLVLVELHAYNIGPKNFQLLVRSLNGPDAVGPIMRAVILSYEGYFAHKYHNREPLFYDVYKSTKVSDIQIAVALSQAFHREHLGWHQSSRSYYLSKIILDWVRSDLLIEAAGGRAAYRHSLACKPRMNRRLLAAPQTKLLRSIRPIRSPAAPNNLLVDNLSQSEWSLGPNLS